MSQKERNMAGYICALLISLAAMAAGVFCVFYPLYHKWVCTQPATAAVVDFYVERKDHRQHSYPIFQYKAEGKTVRIRHNVSPTPYKIGDQVEILYNPVDPEPVLYPSFLRRKLGLCSGRRVFLLHGGVFCSAGPTSLAAAASGGEMIGYPFFFIGSTKE